MNSEMQFKGFKFRKSEFKFKNKKEYNKYFDNALIESPFQFIRISKAEFNEMIHIALSWMEITKIISWILLGTSILSTVSNLGINFGLSMIVLGLASMALSKLYKNKTEDLALGKSFCIQMYEMNNFENLESVREDLIKENK